MVLLYRLFQQLGSTNFDSLAISDHFAEQFYVCTIPITMGRLSCTGVRGKPRSVATGCALLSRMCNDCSNIETVMVSSTNTVVA